MNFSEVLGVFGLIISESKTEILFMPITRAPATQIGFNATGQKYHPTTPFPYLRGAVTETLNILTEIDRWIRVGRMGFMHDKRELYDPPKAQACCT